MISSHPFRFIDLFCGIGGFHQALGGLGGKCVYACDSNLKAQKTYQMNYPSLELDNPSFPSDITLINPQDIPEFEVLCAGFPCQPFSQAGQKKGFSDTHRGNLFFEIMRLVDTQKPSVLFLENVRHLVNHDKGNTFKIIQTEIEKRGYSFSYQILKASDFGLPQHRPRVYMVCFLKEKVPNWNQFSFPKPILLTTTMSDVFQGKVERKIGFTLRVGGRSSPLGDRRNWDGYLVDGVVKRLTQKEGKKMMGFPESFIFPVSEREAMKQLGNAVAVPVVKAIATEIKKVLFKYK